MLKAALANAAFEGRDSLQTEDLELAAELALPHRLRRLPFEQSRIGSRHSRQSSATGAPWIKPVGLNDAEDALFACLINPAIDSVLLYGGHGSGKTLLLERVACLTDRPKCGCPQRDRGCAVWFPDLGAALTSGIRERRPGLLERAHGGFLLLDDAPLLGERLLTIILNVCNKASDTRKGRFVGGDPGRIHLLATAAPEQDLDPKLLETFAFFLPLTPQTTAEERLFVLEHNLKDEESDVLKSQRDELGKAQQGLADVAADRELLRRVVDLTREAGIRLPRVASGSFEGARALAARAGRSSERR